MLKLAAMLVTLMVASDVALPSAGASHVAPTYPVIAGKTIIHASGNSGIIMRVPTQTSVGGHSTGYKLKIEYEPGVFFAGARLITQRPPEDCPLCSEAGIFVYPRISSDYKDDVSTGGIYDVSRWDPGLIHIYLLSNGSFTLTAEFEGLTGMTEVTATGNIDGLVEQVPVRGCDPFPNCDNYGYGYVVREAGRTGKWGFGGVFAWASVPSRWPPFPPMANQGSTSVLACAYPNEFDPDASPDPADHPGGCDTLLTKPTESLTGESIDALGNTLEFFGNGAQQFSMVGQGAGSGIQGPVYLGFKAEAFSPMTGGEGVHYGAIAEWLNEGIECPSEDFFDCDDAHEA